MSKYLSGKDRKTDIKKLITLAGSQRRDGNTELAATNLKRNECAGIRRKGCVKLGLLDAPKETDVHVWFKRPGRHWAAAWTSDTGLFSPPLTPALRLPYSRCWAMFDSSGIAEHANVIVCYNVTVHDLFRSHIAENKCDSGMLCLFPFCVPFRCSLHRRTVAMACLPSPSLSLCVRSPQVRHQIRCRYEVIDLQRIYRSNTIFVVFSNL